MARLSGPDGSLLAIDRDAEHHDSVAAASTGIAPRVVDRVVDGPAGSGVLVVDWVDARTWTPADVADETNLRRVAAACRLLHAGPRFARDFDMFALQRRYLGVVRERGFRLPAGYEDFLPAFEQVAAALAVHSLPKVPCNNDLLAANVLDDGTRLWLIDYEYAGNSDACFELGNIWSEAGLRRAAPRRPGRGLLRGPAPPPRRARPAARPGVGVRLDPVGVHPGRRQPARLRLLVMGDGEVRAGRRRLHRADAAPPAR